MSPVQGFVRPNRGPLGILRQVRGLAHKSEFDGDPHALTICKSLVAMKENVQRPFTNRQLTKNVNNHLSLQTTTNNHQPISCAKTIKSQY